MKHLLRMLVCALLLIALCAFAQAEENEPEVLTSGEYEYVLLKDGTAEITKFNGAQNVLILPDTLDGHAVSSLAEDAIPWAARVTAVIIPNSMTKVGENYAVDRFVFLPDHPVLARIDGVMFSKPDKRLISYPYNKEDTAYRVPDGIEIIGDSAFSECENLTSIILPESLTAIENNAFNCCYNLKTITIPENVKRIGEAAFLGCSNMREANLRGGVVTIGKNAFYRCEYLTEMNLPDTVTEIGEGAFGECYRLARISIPASVTAIGENAFEYCGKLTATVARGSYAEQYCIENGLYFQYPDSLNWLNK
ncbi:MAG: leucine-rich repeat domain-containing protein [Clostridia bacterium]|nr:leucine-rich repeat domain-containing protein [Clostridia bacterium]